MEYAVRQMDRLHAGERFWDRTGPKAVLVVIRQIEIAPNGCPDKVHINETMCYENIKVDLA